MIFAGVADRRLPLGNKAERPWPANVIHKKDAVASHSMRRCMPGGPRTVVRFARRPASTLCQALLCDPGRYAIPPIAVTAPRLLHRNSLSSRFDGSPPGISSFFWVRRLTKCKEPVTLSRPTGGPAPAIKRQARSAEAGDGSLCRWGLTFWQHSLAVASFIAGSAHAWAS